MGQINTGAFAFTVVVAARRWLCRLPTIGRALTRTHAADEPTWFEYDMAERQAKIKGLGGRFDKERRRWYVP